MPAPPALPSRSVGVSPPKPRTATRPPAPTPVELATPVRDVGVRELPREVPVRGLPVREAPKTKVVVTSTTKTSLLSHDAGTTERETLLGPVGKSIMPEVPGVLVAAQRPPERAIETPNRGDVSSGLPPVPNLPPKLASTAAPPAEPSSRGQLDSLSNERTHFNVGEEPTRRSSALPASRDEDDVSTNEKTSPVVRLPLSRRLRSHPLVWFAAGCACTLLLVMMTQGNSTEPNTAVAAPAQSAPAAVVPAEPAIPAAPTQALALGAPSPPEPRHTEVDVSTGATEAEVVEAPEVAKAEVREQKNPRPRAAKARAYKARSSQSSAKRKKSFVPSGL